MGAKNAGGRELAELVSDHRLRHEHGHVLAAVVHGDRVPDHLGEDRRRTRPRPDGPLAARLVHLLNAVQEPLLREGPLLAGSTHCRLPLPRRRPRTMSLFDSLFLARVRFPSVGTPQGVTGWRPPFDLPSPPPCGWSMGFMAAPRTDGRLPSQRLRPALPLLMFSWSRLPTWPTVARQVSRTRRSSPDGRRRTAWPSSFATSWIPEPALRAICP